MNNAEKFKQIFGLYATELWAMPEEKFLEWLNAEALEQDRWIPVTERLPEYGTEVLTQLSDNDIVVNWVIDEEDGVWFEYDVIAWRPLPKPYQEGES